MKQVNLKMLIVLAIAILGLTSCEKENSQLLLNDNGLTAEEQATLDQLPDVINIVAYEDTEGKVTAYRTRSSNGNITAPDVQGTYNGKLSNIFMNKPKGDKDDKVITYIRKNGMHKFDFKFKPFKIGTMPMKLKCSIQGIDLNTNGSFDVPEGDTRLEGKLKIGGIGFNVTKMKGNFTPYGNKYKLHFEMESHGKILTFTILKAHVDYDGVQK